MSTMRNQQTAGNKWESSDDEIGVVRRSDPCSRSVSPQNNDYTVPVAEPSKVRVQVQGQVRFHPFIFKSRLWRWPKRVRYWSSHLTVIRKIEFELLEILLTAIGGIEYRRQFLKRSPLACYCGITIAPRTTGWRGMNWRKWFVRKYRRQTDLSLG